MSDLDPNDYQFDEYELEYFLDLEGPPIIHKKHRLIAAVVQNQVGVLQDLLDSPEWYNVTDKLGYNLLQIAILRDKVEVFDYLMSLPDFPLEYEICGDTALVISLEGFVSNDIWMQEHFSYELVKKGASIDKVCYSGNTPLHCALDRSHWRTAKLLIEKGVNFHICNDQGDTTIEMALYGNHDLFLMLLMMGAEPSMSHFEHLVLTQTSEIVRETLFWHLFDECLRPEVRLDVILKLAEIHPRLFYDLVELSVKPQVEEFSAHELFASLCKMSTNELQVVLEKFGALLKDIFWDLNLCEGVWHDMVIPLINLDLIRDSFVGSSFIVFISNLVSIKVCNYLCMMELSESALTKQYCFLLSCNMRITDNELVLIYKHYGYCELFKILLQMDIEQSGWTSRFKTFMPVLICDINADLGVFLENPKKYSEDSVDELVSYFAHVKLRKLYRERAERNLVQPRDLREIPLLLELARDVFRKHFVKAFNMKSSRQFYTYLDRLPISEFHKKVISYEVKLY